MNDNREQNNQEEPAKLAPITLKSFRPNALEQILSTKPISPKQGVLIQSIRKKFVSILEMEKRYGYFKK